MGISAVSKAPLIGVFGGTFDPIHCGHLAIAQELMRVLPLARILFVPAVRPPHRVAPMAAAGHRLEMVKLALRGHPQFAVDETEYGRVGPSYTADTLLALRRHYRQPLALILGMDAFLGLPGWHRWRQLIGMAHLVIVRRPGFTGPLPSWVRPRLAPPAALAGADHGLAVLVTTLNRPESATVLRQALRHGPAPPGWLPAGVPEYIAQHGLYRGND
ncbi:MAG: nicotinate-nucleotide adenylyltransferase [Gammaproteobacteria bacterium]|nr:nicotinate-nucleotide adenylyltransferase [Gammaproteobacteria bacterium]